jgi:beta-barrel assembly-enhancing protease
MSYGDPYGRQATRRGPKVGGRMIIGLILMVIAFITYYSRTEVNPVTGEKQRVAMGAEQEMALGLKAAPDMARQMGGVVDPARDPDAARVATVGRRLAYDTEAAKSPYAKENNFNFYLLNDTQTINAFALPGGQIFITRALYDRFENEAQLAGVLGHEVGHVIHRHGAEHMATGQLGQMLVTAVAVGASDQQGGNMAAMAAQMASQMTQLKYGRDDELESDAYGMRLMAEVGYEPAEMLGVMKILAEAGKGSKQPEMLLTHPYPENRMEQIKQILDKYGPEWSKKQLTKGPSLR